MLSTHILPEVQATCDEIMMIEHGRVVFTGSLRDFNNYMAPSTFVLVLEQTPPVEELAAIPGILKVEHLTPTRFRLHFDGEDHGMTRRVAALAVEKGWRPSEIMLERDSLDTVFAQLSGKGVASLHTGAHTDAAASRS